MIETFVTADTHIGHDAIVKLSGRPYANGDAMSEDIIRRWNATVQDGDLVYHLGDFAFAKGIRVHNTWDQLKGRKTLIAGNHDRNNGNLSKLSSAVMDYHGMRWGMVHDPDFAGIVGECDHILCGHVHGAWKLVWRVAEHPAVAIINVGVDVQGFGPVRMDTVVRFLSKMLQDQDTAEKRRAHNEALGTDHHGRAWGRMEPNADTPL